MVVGATQAGLGISEKADLLGFSHTREFAESGLKKKNIQ